MSAPPSPPPTSAAETPVTDLRGVGGRVAERLAALGIQSVQDCLFHLPLRYQDRTRIHSIGGLQHGDQVVVEGRVEQAEVRMGRRRSLLVLISDASGALLLRFFYFSQTQRAQFVTGARIRCFGEVRQGPNRQEMVHPEYRIVAADAEFPVEERLTPIYPTTEGLQQASWRAVTDQALLWLGQHPEGLTELLPEEMRRDARMPPLADALRYIHRPPPDAPQDLLAEGLHPAQQRLAFEELLAHQVSLRRLRHSRRAASAPVLLGDGALRQRLLEGLPFRPTGAQVRVVEDIRRDLERDHPMMRLVQGDVGAGKTLVAALAALQAIEAGFQAAVMAPTELLAEQHRNSFARWFEPLGVETTWLTGRHKGRARERALAAIAEGTVRLAVGTHALFQHDVAFHALGLVVIDEQHRFGVHQRMALHEKGRSEDGRLPHQLIMTATPIPRSLAMTAYADLDLSVIDELPPGRTPVTTVAIPDTRREEVMERVRAACRPAEGQARQAYWVCTLVEESEALQCQAAEETALLLAEALSGLRIGLVHGRIKARDKEAVMAQFKAGEIDLLVATTVIEVGVDVPNASLMVIENPERLGLAQLHQLRGRVGRGARESHCVLMYHPPLSLAAQERIGLLRRSTDGFEIARKDLELRGPGEVLGVRQTGELQFRCANLLRDQELLEGVHERADEFLTRYPRRAEALVRRWIGGRTRYIQV